MLKSLAKKPKISTYHVLGVGSFYILLSNDAFLDFFIDLRTFVVKFLRRDLRTFSADFFVTEKQTPQTFSLLECMTSVTL